MLVPDALDGLALIAYAEARGRAAVAFAVPWVEWLPLDDPPFAAGERVHVSIARPQGYELARRLASRGVKVHELVPAVGGSWGETWQAYRDEREAEEQDKHGANEDDPSARA